MDKLSTQFASSYTLLNEKLVSWMNEIILQLPNFAIALFIAFLSFFISKYIYNHIIVLIFNLYW